MPIGCITKVIDYASRLEEFHIYLLADLHLGNNATDEKLIRRWIHHIEEDDHAYWIGMGDMCEWINRSDKRFDPDTLPSWLWGERDLAATQRGWLTRAFEPIAEKCLCLVEGTHEESIRLRNERDVYYSLAENLKLQNVCLGHRGFLRISFRRVAGEANPSTFALKLYLSHGWGGGRKAGAGALRLEEIAGYVDGVDIIAIAHYHWPRYLPLEKWRMVGKKATAKTVHTLTCPSMCRDPAYAGRKDMRPVPIGIAEIIVHPGSIRELPQPDDIRVELHII